MIQGAFLFVHPVLYMTELISVIYTAYSLYRVVRYRVCPYIKSILQSEEEYDMEREMHSAILVGGSMLNREWAPTIEKEYKQVVAKSTPAVYEVIEKPYYY